MLSADESDRFSIWRNDIHGLGSYLTQQSECLTIKEPKIDSQSPYKKAGGGDMNLLSQVIREETSVCLSLYVEFHDSEGS